MDLTTIDVTDAGEIRRGDVVVLIGEQGSERITAEEVALHAQTIPWEVLCHLGNRVPRIYCRGGQAVTMRSRFGAGPGPGLGPLA